MECVTVIHQDWNVQPGIIKKQIIISAALITHMQDMREENQYASAGEIVKIRQLVNFCHYGTCTSQSSTKYLQNVINMMYVTDLQKTLFFTSALT
jgi:hypothetical protein